MILEEVKTFISKLNVEGCRKTGIFVEKIRYDDDPLVDIMHRSILNTSNAGSVPKDWRDAIIIP